MSMGTMGTTYGSAGGSTTRTSGPAPPSETKSDLLDFAKKMAERRFVPGQKTESSAPAGLLGGGSSSTRGRGTSSTRHVPNVEGGGGSENGGKSFADIQLESARRSAELKKLQGPTFQRNAWGGLEVSDADRIRKEYGATGGGSVSFASPAMGGSTPTSWDADHERWSKASDAAAGRR
jgi:hypothetical protein